MGTYIVGESAAEARLRTLEHDIKVLTARLEQEEAKAIMASRSFPWLTVVRQDDTGLIDHIKIDWKLAFMCGDLKDTQSMVKGGVQTVSWKPLVKR